MKTPYKLPDTVEIKSVRYRIVLKIRAIDDRMLVIVDGGTRKQALLKARKMAGEKFISFRSFKTDTSSVFVNTIDVLKTASKVLADVMEHELQEKSCAVRKKR